MNTLFFILTAFFFTLYGVLFWQKVATICQIVASKVAYEQSYYLAKGLLSYAQAYYKQHKATLFTIHHTLNIPIDSWPASHSPKKFSGELFFKKESSGLLIRVKLFDQGGIPLHTLSVKLPHEE